MMARLLRETGTGRMECRALHHLERSVDWKLWGRELRGLRARPFFLLLSPARHWLPAQPVPPGSSAKLEPFPVAGGPWGKTGTAAAPPSRTVLPSLQGVSPVERFHG